MPYRMYLNERGVCKVEIVLVQGKKNYDKRDAIKQKDSKRALDRAMKEFR